jgi:L-gulonate 3-dehydrogenase
VAEVVAQRRALLPLEEWDARVAWRDRMLMAVIAAKQRPVI